MGKYAWSFKGVGEVVWCPAALVHDVCLGHVTNVDLKVRPPGFVVCKLQVAFIRRLSVTHVIAGGNL